MHGAAVTLTMPMHPCWVPLPCAPLPLQLCVAPP